MSTKALSMRVAAAWSVHGLTAAGAVIGDTTDPLTATAHVDDPFTTASAVFRECYTVTVDRFGAGSFSCAGETYTEDPETVTEVNLGAAFSAQPDSENGEPYTFLAWRIGERNRIVLEPTFNLEDADANESNEVSVDLVFTKLSASYSSQTYEISSNGPTMPDVTVNINVSERPSWVVPQEYSFALGVLDGGRFKILNYPDHGEGVMYRSDKIESGPLTEGTFTVVPDVDSQDPVLKKKTWRQSAIGVGGGYPSEVNVSCKFTLTDGSGNTFSPSISRTYPDSPDNDDTMFVIVGQQPTAIDTYINTLSVETRDGLYVVQEGEDDARVAGSLISVPLFLNGSLGDDYVTQQMQIMLKKMHIKESASRQFWPGSTDPDYVWDAATAGASRAKYPFWQNSNTTSVACGVGLYQLSSSEYKKFETIWNWKQNTLMATKLMLEAFSASCTSLATDPPVFEGQDENVFLQGLDLDFWASLDATRRLNVMRRLHAFNRFNGGLDDRYYWRNLTAPVPGFIAMDEHGSITATSIGVDYTNTNTAFSFSGVSHSVDPGNSAVVCDVDWESHCATANVELSFSWETANTSAMSTTDFVSDTYNLIFRMQITSTTEEAAARIVDTSLAEADYDAGFRPPAEHWVKFGYLEPAGPWSTSAYRDYNCDGVRDLNNANPYGAAGGSLQNSARHNSSTRYSDLCELMTGEH